MTEKSEQDRRFETLKREIAKAVHEQGDEASENFLLRDAIDRARSINMPDDFIADARAEGRDAFDYEEDTLEGHASNGVAVMIEILSKDRRRSAHQIEELFEAHGGSLGNDGSAAWQFERRGVVEVEADSVEDGDSFMLEAIEMGVEEFNEPVGSDTTYQLYCTAEDVPSILRALHEADYEIASARVAYEPTQTIPLDREQARSFLQFFEKLRLREDVLGAYANWTPA